MPKNKKDARNFTCKFDKDIFEQLEEYCKIARQTKTAVVERAVEKYVQDNIETIKGLREQL